MPRVKRVAKARKDPGPCGRCSKELKKGDAYRWWQFFRSKYKHVRCMDLKCAPRASELTQSKYSGVYAAQEYVEDALDAWCDEMNKWDSADKPDVDDLKSEVESAADDIKDIADEYRDGAGAIEENFPGSEQASMMEECADGLEEYAENLIDSLDNVDSEPDELEINCIESWASDVRTAVEDALQGDLPDQPGWGG